MCVTINGIFGEGSQVSTNQKRESTVFSVLASDWSKFETLPRKCRTLYTSSRLTNYTIFPTVKILQPSGRYCVIPCTYDGSSSGEFVLRFFTTKTIDVRYIPLNFDELLFFT